MQQLPQELITKALALTGKTMEEMKEAIHKANTTGKYRFSIEKFCFYLLSPEFIEKYEKITKQKYWEITIFEIWESINYYQKGNSQLLKNLLSKI